MLLRAVECMRMNIAVKTYYPEQSFIHRLDTRLKILLLVAVTAGVFWVHSLMAMLACFVLLLLLMVASRVPAHAYVAFLPVACVFTLCPIVFNGFAFDVYAAQDTLITYYQASPSQLEYAVVFNMQPLVLCGTFGIVPLGVLHGAVLGLRIFILMYVSLLFTFTTQANNVVKAIDWFLQPLSRVHVPVHAISLVFSLALRFIPLIAQEFGTIANAHWCRGAHLENGSLFVRARAWSQVFIPLFVRLYRQAEITGCAMDARCYGATRCSDFPNN